MGIKDQLLLDQSSSSASRGPGIGYRLLYFFGFTPWDSGEAAPGLVELIEGPDALPPGRALDRARFFEKGRPLGTGNRYSPAVRAIERKCGAVRQACRQQHARDDAHLRLWTLENGISEDGPETHDLPDAGPDQEAAERPAEPRRASAEPTVIVDLAHQIIETRRRALNRGRGRHRPAPITRSSRGGRSIRPELSATAHARAPAEPADLKS